MSEYEAHLRERGVSPEGIARISVRPVRDPLLQAPADMASEALVSEVRRGPRCSARSAALWAEIRHRLGEWQAIYRGLQRNPTRSDAR